jgi:hypothetical protein
MLLSFSGISGNCFCIGKVMDRVYGSRDHGRLSVHGGLIEKEEVVGVPTNDATWSRSCVDGYMMTLNRGVWWCFDGEMILGARRRGWSRGGCGG